LGCSALSHQSPRPAFSVLPKPGSCHGPLPTMKYSASQWPQQLGTKSLGALSLDTRKGEGTGAGHVCPSPLQFLTPTPVTRTRVNGHHGARLAVPPGEVGKRLRGRDALLRCGGRAGQHWAATRLAPLSYMASSWAGRRSGVPIFQIRKLRLTMVG
jgi:hypothetical protein